MGDTSSIPKILRGVTMPVEKLSKITVLEIMDTDYQMVKPDSSLSEAIGVMLKHKQYELPVVASNGMLQGLLSYYSLAKAGRMTMNEKVDGLQLNIPKMTAQDTVSRAAELLLSSDHRLLPVTRNRKVVGVIRRNRIIELASDLETWKGMKVTELMHQPVEVVNGSDRLTKAKTMMRNLDIRTIPVVDKKGFLTGVIGMSDIISYLRPKRRKQLGDFSGEKIHFDPEVQDVMISYPYFVEQGATVDDAIQVMQEQGISSIVITKDKTPLGVVSNSDILEFIVSSGRKQKQVFVNISGLEHEDLDVMDGLFGILDNALNKINKIYTPRVLNIHVNTYNYEGNEAKYSVHMRLSTTKHLYITKTVNWDPFKAFADGCDNLYAQVIKKKEMSKNHKTGKNHKKK